MGILSKKNPLGIRKISKNAAEQYQVKDDYKRFNQKYNMIWQPSWKSGLSGYGDQQRLTSGLEKVRRNRNGYTVLDWAFLRGAEANFWASDFPINVGDQTGNSWNPIRMGLPEGIDRWENSETEAARIVRKVAAYYGADQIGICRLDRRWIFSDYFDPDTNQDYPIRFSDEASYENVDKPQKMEDGTAVIPSSMKYVIVMLQEMDYDAIKTAPTMTQMASTHIMYSKIAFTAASVAEFLRGLGYDAIPSANDTALNIPLAIDAGLGQLGRNAKLISPRYGPRCRISKVITDLPLEVDQPIDFGVTEYCETCKICAESCPVKAIPEGPRSYEPEGDFSHQGVLQWQMDHQSCRKFWASKGTNCGICLAKCPYNQKGLRHWIGKSITAAKSPVLNKLLTAAADLPLLDSREFWAK